MDDPKNISRSREIVLPACRNVFESVALNQDGVNQEVFDEYGRIGKSRPSNGMPITYTGREQYYRGT